MSGCSDEQYKGWLELYLLDLLSEEQLEEFELHLLECEECSSEVVEDNKMSMHIARSPKARHLIDKIIEEQPDLPVEGLPDQPEPTRAERKWISRLPVALAAAAVLVLLLLKPWQIEISPDKAAVALENRLAVMPFANLVDYQDTVMLGKTASTLLITDLSESRVLQVVSDQQLNDIVKAMGQEGVKVIDSRLASQIADKAQANWIFMGNIRQVQPQFVLDIALIDASQGDTVVSSQINGEPDDNVFTMVDRLTVEIKKSLASYLSETPETDRPVADMTTHSEKAYFHYLKGIENYDKMYNHEAIADFMKAISFDSTFAMVYYYLAVLKDRKLIDKALKYSQHASRDIQYHIRARAAIWAGDTATYLQELDNLINEYPNEKAAYYRLGLFEQSQRHYQEAVNHYRQAIKIDPNYKVAYNQLAYLYDAWGKYDSALSAIDKYISVAPDEANPYDSRGDIYANWGKIDSAISSYEMAVRQKPDFWASIQKLASLNHLTGRYDEAKKWYGWRLPERPFIDSLGIDVNLANILISQGKLDSALLLLDSTINLGKLRQIPQSGKSALQGALLFKAIILYEIDSLEPLQLIKEAVHIDSLLLTSWDPWLLQFYAQYLAREGHYTQAKKVARDLESRARDIRYGFYRYWYTSGCIEFAKQNYSAAIEYFEKNAKLATARQDFTGRFMLARAYIGAGRFNDAISEFQQQLKSYNPDRASFALWSAKIHYYMGIAYEGANLPEKAKEQYKTFLEVWRQANPELRVIKDARARLKRLS